MAKSLKQTGVKIVASVYFAPKNQLSKLIAEVNENLQKEQELQPACSASPVKKNA